MSTPKSITLPAEVIAKIESQVDLSAPGALETFIADALNAYMQIGGMSAQGAQFLVRNGEEGTPRRVRFPFENAAA